MNRLRVAIAGGSGYTGGELARLLLFHPQVELTQVASSSFAGHYLHSIHPNLRKQSTLRFCHPDDLISDYVPPRSTSNGMARLMARHTCWRRASMACLNCIARNCAAQLLLVVPAAWQPPPSSDWLHSIALAW